MARPNSEVSIALSEITKHSIHADTDTDSMEIDFLPDPISNDHLEAGLSPSTSSPFNTNKLSSHLHKIKASVLHPETRLLLNGSTFWTSSLALSSQDATQIGISCNMSWLYALDSRAWQFEAEALQAAIARLAKNSGDDAALTDPLFEPYAWNIASQADIKTLKNMLSLCEERARTAAGQSGLADEIYKPRHVRAWLWAASVFRVLTIMGWIAALDAAGYFSLHRKIDDAKNMLFAMLLISTSAFFPTALEMAYLLLFGNAWEQKEKQFLASLTASVPVILTLATITLLGGFYQIVDSDAPSSANCTTITITSPTVNITYP